MHRKDESKYAKMLALFSLRDEANDDYFFVFAIFRLFMMNMYYIYNLSIPSKKSFISYIYMQLNKSGNSKMFGGVHIPTSSLAAAAFFLILTHTF